MSQRKFWMRWRVRAGYPVGIGYWLLARPTRHSIVYAATIAAFGLIVRTAASGHLRKDRELATSGPYACTRNPLYLGSALLAAAFAVGGHSWPGGITVMAYFVIFYYAVMRNEEEDLRARFGVLFDNYASRVPLFFPRPPAPAQAGAGASASNGKFSLDQYLQNREYKALIGVAAGLATLWLRSWIRARWGY